MNDKKAIISAIRASMEEILGVIGTSSEAMLNKARPGKWNIAEQMVHLNKSVAPLNMAMGLPKLTFILFGKAAFSRSFDEITEIYKSSLSNGAKASRVYIPSEGKIFDKARLEHDFAEAYEKYLSHIAGWSESDMDTFRLPHPIIGKLTMREMAYFTQYHMGHHLADMKGLLSPSS